MKKIWFILILTSYFTFSLNAQNSELLKIKIGNFNSDTLFLSIYQGESTKYINKYPKDKDGYFRIKKSKEIVSGIYIFGSKKNEYFRKIVIDTTEKSKEIIFDLNKYKKIKYNTSQANKELNEYQSKQFSFDSLIAVFTRKQNFQSRDSIRKIANNNRVELLKKIKSKVVSQMINSELEWFDISDSKILKAEENKINTLNRINHYLDNIDLSDGTSLHLPRVYGKIMEYFDLGVQIQHNLVNQKLDSIFSKMGFQSEMIQYYLPQFERKYSFTFQPWVDTVYAYLSKKYYDKAICPWLEQSEIDRVKSEADKRMTTLIGMPMPDVTLETHTGAKVRLWDIKAKYLVIDFWRPGCSHCTESMPIIENAKRTFEDQDVVFVGICTRTGSDAKMCWENNDNVNHSFFNYNLADPKGNTNFLNKFNVGGVPMIYIIDDQKNIIDKKVPPSNLIYRLVELTSKK